MLQNRIKNDPLFNEISHLLAPMGLQVVDAIKNDTPQGVQMILSVYSADHEVNTDDLAEVYNIIFPRYQVVFGERDLSLEVSSPGLQRNLRDIYEFSVFEGKLARVYSTSVSSWVEGYIEASDDESVTLRDAIIADTEEKRAEMKLSYTDIAKAKLAFRWEEE